MVDTKIMKIKMNKYVEIFNTIPADKYPFSAMLLSIGHIHIMNQQELAGRIKELSEILNYRFMIQPKEKDGKMIPYIEVN